MIRSRVKTQSESELKRKAKKRLKERGYTVQYIHALKPPGMPDWLVYNDLVSFWVEWKTPRGRLSVKQKEMLDILSRGGARVYVLNSLEGLENILQEVEE